MKTRLAALLSKEFSAPTSATSGIASYSLEGGAKHTYPERAALLRVKPKKQLTSLIPLLPFKKDDVRSMTKGGEGSGNFGHAGRPGEVGGSAPAEDETEVDMSADALAQALDTMRPDIEQSYTRRVKYAWERLQEKYPNDPYKAGNDWSNYQHLNVVRGYFKNIGGNTPTTRKVVLDEDLLAAGAKQYAELASREWHGKLSGKVGELESAKLIYGRGANLSISGSRGGKKVNIHQQMIVNVSSKGAMFNQFPARIYVDGKAISEVAYKKMFSTAQKFDYTHEGDCPCGKRGTRAILKAAKKSRVRDYVLKQLPPLTKAIHRLLVQYGTEWAKTLAKELPIAEKGDFPGHPFRGNQYTDADDARDRYAGMEDVPVTGVERWWDKHTRNWVVQRKDKYGNETHRSDYTYQKEAAESLVVQYLDYHKEAVRIKPAKKTDLSRLIKAAKTVEEILIELEMEGFSAAVLEEITPTLEKAFKDGGLSALEMVGIKNDVEDMLTLMNQDALEFAQTRAAELVGKRIVDGEVVENPNAKWSIDETTRKGLQNIVSDAIKNGWSAGELQERILDSFFFSDKRAEMIARTELAFAHVQGNIRGWVTSGVVAGKRSILADTHPFEDVCDENEAIGIIPLMESFPDGSMGPPYHPNCLCDIVPVLDDEMDENK